MNFSIQNTPRVATMKSNGLFGWKMDLAEPKAAVQKIDRGMYDYPFDEQEHHRTGESTYFDDWLCYIILKDNDHVRYTHTHESGGSLQCNFSKFVISHRHICELGVLASCYRPILRNLSPCTPRLIKAVISDMKGVFPACSWVQLTPHLATDFSRQTWSTKYWAVGWHPYLSNRWMRVHAWTG